MITSGRVFTIVIDEAPTGAAFLNSDLTKAVSRLDVYFRVNQCFLESSVMISNPTIDINILGEVLSTSYSKDTHKLSTTHPCIC